MDKKVKNFLEKGAIACLIIAALMALLLTLQYDASYYKYYDSYSLYKTTIAGWGCLFYGHFYSDSEGICWMFFIIGSLCLITAIVLGIMYLVLRKCELQITENNVKGKTLLGKEVVLPLYMVSAYSTRKFLSTISVATASGITKFALIGNYQEIGEVLSKKINERQQKTEASATKPAEADSLDQLTKLKALLDNGVISQEEFDAKKKQLLGL